MNIAIIGASGKQGQALLKEALSQHLSVTAVVRDAQKIQHAVAILEKDVLALDASDLKPFDVVINAFGSGTGSAQSHVTVGRHLMALLQHTPTRLVVVGGAGSLFVNPEQTVALMQTAEFPEQYQAIAQAQGQNLKDLQASTDLNWVFVSPAAFFDPEGVKTGKTQLGHDQLILNSQQQSYVSYADYAAVVIAEVMQPQHHNERFSVVGEAQ